MKEIKHNCQIRVRYADTDKMGVVYNGNYFTYFEIGRTELMRAMELPYKYYESQGYYLPLVASYAEYKISALYDDLLTVEAELVAELTAKVRFNYRIMRDEELIAEGYTIHCFMDSKTMKPVRPPKFHSDFIKN